MECIPSHPVLTCAEAKAWEVALLNSPAKEWRVLRQAGTAIANAVEEDFLEIGGLPVEARLLVLVGKGHNGGDALLAAASLFAKRRHITVDVVFAFGSACLRPLAKRAWQILQRTGKKSVRGVSVAQFLLEDLTYALSLDGVFGFQFRPPIDAATSQLFAAVNRHPEITLRAAVDLPSGLGGEGKASVLRADFTYATGIVKTPAVVPENGASVGRLRYLDFGFFRDDHSTISRVLRPKILRPLGKLRGAHTDKRTYGHLLVVAGSRSFPGAALMAAQAALCSGVGLLTAFVPKSFAAEYAVCFPEAIWVGCPETKDGGLAPATLALVREKLPRATALLIGPGLGAEAQVFGWINQLVYESTVPVVLDADALRSEVVECAPKAGLICTPHSGEYQRISANRSLTEFAASNRIVVLKGSPTRISAGRTVFYSLFGGPVLARGGSGDVLAGLAGGLLSQNSSNLLLAACCGVVWHGFAADLLARHQGQVAIKTTQLFDYLPLALRYEVNGGLSG